MSLFSRTWPNTSNQPALNPITLQPEHKTERMVHARLQRGTLHCAFTYPTSLVRQATRAAGRERCAYVLAISDIKEDRRVPEAEEEPALRRARARSRGVALYCIARLQAKWWRARVCLPIAYYSILTTTYLICSYQHPTVVVALRMMETDESAC
jgi:hypothetical protein